MNRWVLVACAAVSAGCGEGERIIPSQDASVVRVDAAAPPVPPADSGAPTETLDAGSLAQDAATVDPDAAMSARDAAGSAPDAATDAGQAEVALVSLLIAGGQGASTTIPESVTLPVAYTPSNATNQELSWTVCTAQPTRPAGAPATLRVCTESASLGTVTWGGPRVGGIYAPPPSVAVSPTRVFLLACQVDVCDWTFVDVFDSGPAPTSVSIASFVASPSTVNPGGRTSLSWAASNATALSIAASSGSSPGAVSGTSISVSPTCSPEPCTVTYTLTAEGQGGPVSKSATVSVAPPGSAFGAQPWLVSDTTARSTPTIAKPGYLQPVCDPTFKTRITRITGGGGPAYVGVGYPKRDCWSADQKLIYLSRGGNMYLDGDTYQVVYSSRSPPSGGERRWHPTLADWMVVVANNGDIWHWNVRTGATSKKYTATEDCSTNQCRFGNNEGNASLDGRYVVVTNQATERYWMVDTQTGTRVSPVLTIAAAGISSLDWATATPSGQYILVSQSSQKQVVLDRSGAIVGGWGQMGHYDQALLPDGREVAYSGGDGVREIPSGTLVRSGHSISAYHSSARNLLAPGWGFGNNNTTGYLRGEIYADSLTSARTLRLVHHRNTGGDYETDTYFCVSRDGYRVVYQSDWLSGAMDTYVVDSREECR